MKEFWQETKTILIGVPLLWIGAIASGYLMEVFETHYWFYLFLIFVVVPTAVWIAPKIYQWKNNKTKDS